MMAYLVFCTVCAIYNRARGTKFFKATDSTELGRLGSMFGIALSTAAMQYTGDDELTQRIFLWTWATMMFWCTFRWDALWAETIGNDKTHTRLDGLIHFMLRELYGAPVIIALSELLHKPEHLIYAPLTALLAVPYYIFGLTFPSKWNNKIIMASELTGGVIWATLITLTIS